MNFIPETSPLNVEVSCFKNYYSKDNPKTVNLLSWLLSNKYCKAVEEIRDLPNKKDRDKIKATPTSYHTKWYFHYEKRNWIDKT